MAEYNAFDRSLPRVRKKTEGVLSRSEIKKYARQKGLTEKQFSDVMRVFHEELIDEMINNVNGVILPSQLACLEIKSKRSEDSTIIDHKTSRELGKVVYFTNYNTDSHVANIMYTTPYGFGFKDSKLWTLRTTRAIKEKVSKNYRVNWERYKVMCYDNNRRSSI